MESYQRKKTGSFLLFQKQRLVSKSSYEYDALGRITKVTSGSKKDVSYVYDDADNLQAIVYPDGTKVSYEYDLNDNLVKLTDRNGKVTTYKHDALNRVTEVIRSNGTKTEVSYDAEDHITKIMNTCGSCGKVISTYEYKYNDQGYVVGETATELEAGTRKTPSWEDWYNWGDTQKETDKADCEHQEKEIQTTRTYEYDDNWELTRCTEKAEGGKKTVHNYTYDKIGNRTSYEKIEDGVSKAKYNYKYNDSNQLIKRTNAKIWGDPGTTYSYDKDGNLIQECDKTNSADPVTYEYTAENRLAVVKQGGTVLMAAMYDGDNNRVFELDNTYKWEDCYGDEVLIPENQRTEDGNSPKEQLASLVKGGSNAKGYTLTEYINDINRENTEVLAEYGADEKVRQAYTYGESGIGERISVDKSEESSYYLYDGRNSVTGILTETANLTNSYQYDPYGNLTSGTADGVNYYAYNGESTNVKTGLQYLRARYYSAENGTFTTEDSDLGTKENPLTRNRYDYATNNPLNYSDPTGHSLWGRIKSAAKKAVKTVTKAAKSVAKTVVSGVKSAAKWVQNTVSHPKQVIQQAKNTVKKKAKQTYQKVASAGSGFVKAVSNGGIRGGFSYVGNGAKKVYSSFKSYAAERTSEIRATIHKEMCTTNNRISSLLGKVDWSAVKKVVAGGVILGGLAAATVLTGGAAAVIAGGALSGALIGGGTGAVLGGISSAASGEGFISGAADGFLWGTIGGAVSGGVGAATGSLASSTASSALKNPLAKSALENVADTAVGTVDDLAHGRDVSVGTVAKDFGTGMLLSGKGITDDWKKTTKDSNFVKNVESNVSENKQMSMNLQFFASKKQEASSEVKWNNGWRTPNGKFASPKGSERAGGQAEEKVWDVISKKDGWGVRKGRIYTKDNTGQVRVYDGAAITPDEEYIGLEVKSGKAQKTKAQREFDNRISKSNPAIGVGQSEGITITHSITIRR